MQNIQIILSLSPSRWREYRDLRLEALKEFPNAFSSKYEEQEKNPKSVWLEALQNPDMDIFFVQDGSTLVGMLMLHYREDFAAVYGMYVDEQYQRSGVGSRLLTTALEISAKKQYARMQLCVISSNTLAIGFYKKHGFRFIEKSESKECIATCENEILMEKVL